MPTFEYRGRDSRGGEVKGQIDAANAGAAADLLSQRQVIPLQVKAKAGAAEGSSFDINDLLPSKVSLDDLSLFTRQMFSLSKAGVPILRAINGLAQSSSSKALKAALSDVAQELEGGRTISTAMSQHPKIFSKLFVAIVHVGENTGRLEDAFKQLSGYLELEIETRKRIKTALRYPSFVVIAIVIALVIMNIMVIPAFADMFKQFGAQLPLPTRILIGMSNFFVEYWWALLLGAVTLVSGTIYAINTPKGRWRWDRFKLRMPIVGDIINRSTLARYARSFSLMLQSGVPLTHALNLVADAVDNEFMGQKIRDMRQGIERGESLLRTANSSELFTPLVMQMIAVGEETGRIDELLLDAAEYYEREVDYDLKTLTARIEPILIGVVAGMVLLLALGIYLPMWDMMSAMKGG
ncbi:type II secretion system F family protein [Corallincola spongiicola]|uniref:Type II secretion system F family protein n=1 Tax=Corallincola spongiicola TaxID=2520508 RepID=A0ABY1WNZ2_9GAMM|nr:type II secretion system F family protein [Corallincola spongiicola]TAA45197.1 type II secretion system F family protein [Corallincola spongiicola]